MKTLKIMNSVTKASEYLKAFHEIGDVHSKFTDLDCTMLPHVDRETEKAYGFDMGEDHETTYRIVWAPKSKVKVIENDYYVDENGKLVTDEKLVLIPNWIVNNWYSAARTTFLLRSRM